MLGMFITIEGIDGSGKTTQIELLHSYLKSLNKDVVITREPGGTTIGEKIRNLILDINNTNIAYITEALLYVAGRAQLVNEIIEPALNSGKIVICDRFIDSSIVYQGIGRNLGIDKIINLNSYALNNIMPDITFYLDIEPEVGISRKIKQDKLDRIENESLEFHKQVCDGYKKISSLYKERIKQIDATQTKEAIHTQICNILKDLL